MKTALLMLCGVGLALVPDFTLAARQAEGETHSTIEADLTQAEARLSAFDESLTFRERKILRQVSERDHERVLEGGGLRKKYEERERLKEEVETLRLMTDLKSLLMNLPGHEEFRGVEARGKEAELVARTAVPAFGELRKDYEMVRPALLHNLLVNMKIKDQGLCWQWARDLMNRLKTLDLRTFDVLWATARGGTMREHNTVVLVSKGRDLQEGLFLDGWKKAGKPFWMMVRDDKKHPWKPGTYYGGRH